ncbi:MULTISPECIES: hypothetical protein [Streptomyces]|uniref:hypothetical protein n=1 Tax=Streptomyces TaxID=1883 RepID=UPI00099D75C4|nr:hypothetical protein [Streptomyces durhamensis]
MTPQQTEYWVGTCHGRHDGTQAKITATRDGTRPEPYAWACTCSSSHKFSTVHDCDRSALRHAAPPAGTGYGRGPHGCSAPVPPAET